MTTLSYDDLVAAATVGLANSRLQVTALPGPAARHAGALDTDDPAAALLDAVALMTAVRRAGVLPATAPGDSEPAPADTAPELPGRAADLLARARASDPMLFAGLLVLAARRGYRAPAPLLPALLEAAVKDRSLRSPVAAVLGARGRWLARHRAEWQRVADAAPPGQAGQDLARPGRGEPNPAAPAGSSAAQLWETGTREQRRGYLAALRESDPAAARELLAAGWAAETGDDRAHLLAVLARNLSGADEQFLEQALDDRQQSVRAQARRLLARLPGSAFSRRAAARVVSLLRVERRGSGREWLVAGLPEGADKSAIRDGLTSRPPDPSIGQRAWLLTQMIASAPLSLWVSALGLDAARIVSLPVAGGLGDDVRAGWRMAAISQASREWAEPLLAADQPGATKGRPPAAWPRDDQLAAVLPPDALAARSAALLTAGPPGWETAAEVARCPGPWPPLLADAVMASLRQVVTAAERPGAGAVPDVWTESLVTAAGRNLPAACSPSDYGAALARLADSSGAHPLAAALRRATDTVALRRAFLEEIQ